MKFRNIITLIAVLSLAIACKRDNLYSEVVPELIHVVSGADLAFKACGGEGDIVIQEDDAALVVTTDQSSWCHITVEGNKIHVVADEHNGLESRYAVLNMVSGERTGKTIVHQFGIIVKSFNPEDITLTNGAKEYVYEYNANDSMLHAESDAEWINVEVSPTALTINVDENTEVEQSREGHISWNIGQMKGVITIFQFDPAAAGMLGDWTIKFYQNKTAKITVTGTLSVNEDGTYSLNVADTKTGLTLSIETPFHKMNLGLPLGVKWGTYATKSATYSLFGLMSPSNSNLLYASAVNTGYFDLAMAKNASNVWVGTGTTDATTGLFHLEGWADDNHEGNSAVSLWYSSIVMTKK